MYIKKRPAGKELPSGDWKTRMVSVSGSPECG